MANAMPLPKTLVSAMHPYRPSDFSDCTFPEGGNHRSASRRSAIMQLAAVALSSVVPVLSAAEPATRRPSDPAKFAGAFVNWGPNGREVALQAWEKWLNQAPSSVVGVDFYAKSTWPDFFALSWVPAIWKKLNPARNV